MTTDLAPTPTAKPTAVTWNAAAPPHLSDVGVAGKAMGAARVAGVILLTALGLVAFMAGRWLHARAWGGVTFHFAVARIWARLMLRLMGVRRRVVGAPMAQAGVLLANHASWADILAIRACQRVNFVSKADVRAWPWIGWIAEQCDTVFIERRRSASKAQEDALLSRLRAGERLCLFPEATSTDGRRVLAFKSALLSAPFEPSVRDALWAQPVTVNWIAPEGLPVEFYCWWGDMPFEGHIWDVVTRSRGGAVEIVFHEPRPVGAFPDRKTLAQWAEDAVRSAKRV
ncbi:MAG: 1-acyl-sn-glycerol-3-phosphate acyltransferase [Rhodobacteraceae bacterium]|nr:MAG: 1-acyl-sn-glycerol-3-phosphate acyltransferase [Paracoccaceae bacterium]